MDDLISRKAAVLAIRRTAEPIYRGEDNVVPAEYEDAIMKLPIIDEYDVVAEYCRKRCLVIMSADLFEKIKREYGGAQWIR